jgi:hypothetical protein
MIRHELFSGSARVNRTVINMNYQWDSTVFWASRTEFSVKRRQQIGNIGVAVHFAAMKEFIENMEPRGFHIIVTINLWS